MPKDFLYTDLQDLTSCRNYEELKNTNEHNALADAIFNKKLYNYLQTRKFE